MLLRVCPSPAWPGRSLSAAPRPSGCAHSVPAEEEGSAVSKAEARRLRRMAKSKEREARRMLLSSNENVRAAARTLLQQVRVLRNSADIEDTLT